MEVDEHQHRERPRRCEEIRMVNIAEALGMPVRFIRYNPDEFKGVDPGTAMRHKKLVDTVTWSLRCRPNVVVDVKYLFFDDVRASTAFISRGADEGQTIPIFA